MESSIPGEGVLSVFEEIAGEYPAMPVGTERVPIKASYKASTTFLWSKTDEAGTVPLGLLVSTTWSSRGGALKNLW